MRSKFEIRGQKTLEKNGWFCDYKARPRWTPRGYNVDYWNLFDILAWKDGEMRFISVKGRDASPKHKQDIDNFKVPKGISKELWRYDRDPANRTRLRCRILRFN